jgi:hypothetical protein
MTTPDFIWATVGQAETPASRPSPIEYIRRDPAVLAALPEVQALVAAAVMEAAERFANHPAVQMRRHVDMQGQWRWDVWRAIHTPDAKAALIPEVKS